MNPNENYISVNIGVNRTRRYIVGKHSRRTYLQYCNEYSCVNKAFYLTLTRNLFEISTVFVAASAFAVIVALISTPLLYVGKSSMFHSMTTESSESKKESGIIEFLRFVGLLKKLKRAGWVRKNVNLPESVADHQYRMGIMGILINDKSVDIQRCVMMAIVHDIAEALAGDITPHDNVSDTEKYILECNALKRMLKPLEDNEASKLIFELWEEYNAGTSKESMYVKDFDKLEMILQADEYEQDQGIDLSDFFESTKGYFKTDQVKEWENILRNDRQQRREKNNYPSSA